MPGKVVPAFSGVAIDHASRVLQSGGLVIVPTDTVYGIAAALAVPEAVARLFVVKRRPNDRPIALLVDCIAQVEQVVLEIAPTSRLLMDECWPGGLTIVLPRNDDVPDVILAGGLTVAVRMPNHPVPRALARRLGAPLPVTSANVSGQPSPKDAIAAKEQLGESVDLILDAGPAPGGVESTVIDLTKDRPTVWRVGAVTVQAIERVLGMKVLIGAAAERR